MYFSFDRSSRHWLKARTCVFKTYPATVKLQIVIQHIIHGQETPILMASLRTNAENKTSCKDSEKPTSRDFHHHSHNAQRSIKLQRSTLINANFPLVTDVDSMSKTRLLVQACVRLLKTYASAQTSPEAHFDAFKAEDPVSCRVQFHVLMC